MSDLLTLDAVAARLGIHPKTLRRLLPRLMEQMPELRVRKIGRSIRFTEDDYRLTVEAMAWRPASADAAKPNARATRSVSTRKSLRSEGTAQERLRERLRLAREDEKLALSKARADRLAT